MKTGLLAGAAIALGATISWATLHAEETKLSNSTNDGGLEQVTLGSGCFWCTEAVFQQLKGVKSAVSGYSGGRLVNPTYEQVCSGNTGHAEGIQVSYDPAQISFTD